MRPGGVMDVVSNLPYCCVQFPPLEDISIRYLPLPRSNRYAKSVRKIRSLVIVCIHYYSFSYNEFDLFFPARLPVVTF